VGAFREDRIPEEPAAALKAMENLLEHQPPGVTERPAKPADVPSPAVFPAHVPASAAAGADLSPPAAPQPADMVRMPAENLDRLVRSTGRILTESLRQASVGGELDAMNGEVAGLAAECVRFRRASSALLRRLAGQPEYSSVIRHIGFVEQQVRFLAVHSGKTQQLQQRSLWRTRHSAEQLQRDVWSARMAPAEDVFEGFRKMVRDLSREENKEIDFRLSGTAVRADRIVLQALKDPVMHLLRNAISHGIETRAERVSKGKSPVGFLILRLDSQRGRLIVEVEDDGRGVDLTKVANVLSEAEPAPGMPKRGADKNLSSRLLQISARVFVVENTRS